MLYEGIPLWGYLFTLFKHTQVKQLFGDVHRALLVRKFLKMKFPDLCLNYLLKIGESGKKLTKVISRETGYTGHQ